jgi:predicted amidophosphoribosyltransferase
MPTDAALAPICERCGYNLTGLAATRCPECGLTFDRDMVRVSWVPWGVSK